MTPRAVRSADQFREVTGDYALVRSLDIAWIDIVAVYPVLLFVAVLMGYVSAILYVRTVETSATTHLERTG